ncbi:MAG: hypothetical protein JNK02_04810 [Planctomycetes bacterium]|nr:hypothetical protein [Planctomycetota bacterium]
MPSALKLQEQYGDALQVIFVECQGASRDQYEAFAWKMKWMGGRALWTEERPFPTVGNGLPETALVGVDGTILMQGHPGGFGKKLEEAIAAEVKKAKDAPEGTPTPLRGAWKSFHKGEVAAALLECDKLGSDDAQLARAEFVARVERRIARAKWLVDQGFPVEASELVGKLAKETKGVPELESKVAAEAARLAEPERAREKEAAKAWDTFVEAVAKKKPFEPANVKRAEGLAEKFAGTKAAERAQRFVALSQVRVGS